LVFGTTTTGTNIKFVVAATSSSVTTASIAMVVNAVNTPTTSTNTGVLIVNGGVGISGGLYAGGVVTATMLNQTSAAVSIGGGAGVGTNGQGSVYIGASAGGNYSGNLQTIGIGFQAGRYNQGSSAIAIGTNAGIAYQGNYSIAIGAGSGQGSGISSVSVGVNSGQNNVGSNSTFIGANAGSAITSGNYNVVIGGNTGSSITTSSNNVIISDGAGNIVLSANGVQQVTIPGSLSVSGTVTATNFVGNLTGYATQLASQPASTSTFYQLVGTVGFLGSPTIAGSSNWLGFASTGYLGIGTSSPSFLLDIAAGTGGGARITQHYTFGGPNFALNITGDGPTTGYISQNPAAGGLVLADGMRYYGAGPWTPDGTTAESIQLLNGSIKFTTNAGLTTGTNFTPTTVFTINSSGAHGFGSTPSYGTSGQILTSAGSGAVPTWTTPSSFQGTTGSQGIQGATGTQGAVGTTGAQGTTGSTGSQGTTGTQGATGSTGSTGSQGTTGSQGATGTQGTAGSNGGTGSQGTTGSTGSQGTTGTQGTQGTSIQGLQGVQGLQGTTGSTGSTGSQGTTGSTGSQGTTGTQGATGTTGSQGTTGPSTAINATASTSNTTEYIVGVPAAGSNQTPVVSTSIYYNPSSNLLYAPYMTAANNLTTANLYGTNYKNFWTGFNNTAYFWQIAQLPASNGGTGDCVYIEITSNTTSVSGKGKIKIALGQRNGFWYQKSYEGGTPQYGIRIYQPTSGGVSNVYLYNTTSTNYPAANVYYSQYGWGATNAAGATLYDNPSPSSTTPTGTVIFDSAVDSTYPVNDALTVGATTVYGALNATGEITAYYSDRRLKENVKPIDNALDKILKLNGITYNPNDLAASFGYDKTLDIVGLFADEVEAVLPQAVKPAPFDMGVNGGSKSGENYKTVQYEKVVPLLVEAIKEQQAQIAQLKAIVDSLVNK
jgi:hypothetical protein